MKAVNQSSSSYTHSDLKRTVTAQHSVNHSVPTPSAQAGSCPGQDPVSLKEDV